MEELVAQYLQVSKTLPSPIETLTYLSICCPRLIKFTTTGPLGSGTINFYSARVTIENGGGSFVVTEQCKEKANEKVAIQACNYLRDEAEKLSAVDEELKQVLAAVELLGFDIETEYQVVLDQSTRENVHHCKIQVLGLGNFDGASPENKKAAYLDAAEKLKSYYKKYFPSETDDSAIPEIPEPSPPVSYSSLSQASTSPEPSFNLPAFNATVILDDVKNNEPKVNEPRVPESQAIKSKVPVFLPPQAFVYNSLHSLPDPAMEMIPWWPIQSGFRPQTHYPFKPLFKDQNQVPFGTVLPYYPVNLTGPSTSGTSQNIPQQNQLVPSSENQSQQTAGIINRFNSVFTNTKNPVSIMNEILQTHSSAFTITTTNIGGGSCKTEVKLFEQSIFKATAVDERQSRKMALTQIFEPLKNISKLFIIFKSVYSPNKSSVAVVNELIKSNLKDTVKISVMRKGKKKAYISTVTIVHLIYFESFASTAIVAEQSAAKKAVDYLKQLSAQITDSPILIKELFGVMKPDEPPVQQSPVSWSNQSFKERWQVGGRLDLPTTRETSVASIQTDSVSSMPMTTYQESAQYGLPANCDQLLFPRDLRLIELINLFIQVYDPAKPPASVMVDLYNAGAKYFDIDIRSTHEYRILASIKVQDLGLFIGEGKTEGESKQAALLKIFDSLKLIDDFFLSFESIYAQSQSPMDYIPLLIARNSTLVMVHTWPKADIADHHVAINIGHLHYCNAFASSESEALALAYCKMAQYLLKFNMKIDRLKPKTTYKNAVAKSTGKSFQW